MSLTCVEFRAKVWPKITVVGKPLVVTTPISFLGDVDADRGILKLLGVSLVGKVLIADGFRGSTVGSYVLYALSKKGLAPKAIVFRKLDPVVVAGCVASSIPMAWSPDLDLELAAKCKLAIIDYESSVVKLCS